MADALASAMTIQITFRGPRAPITLHDVVDIMSAGEYTVRVNLQATELDTAESFDYEGVRRVVVTPEQAD